MSDLERDVVAYAELSAALAQAGEERAGLLAAHGLDEDGWNALDDAWQTRMSDDDGGEVDESGTLPTLLVAYSEAFARALAAGDRGGLDFEGFVGAAVAMKRGADPRGVLQRLGVTMATYLAAQKRWTERMLMDEALAAEFRRRMR